jgi:hypothetical protein
VSRSRVERRRAGGNPAATGDAARAKDPAKAGKRATSDGTRTSRAPTTTRPGSRCRRDRRGRPERVETGGFRLDGGRIAFVRDVHETNPEIFVARSDGSDERRITDNPGADDDPSWQPLR